MHEIHPAHSIASWKEILLHIGIITIGLLMALGIDQTVEFFHHRHQLAEARHLLDKELEINKVQYRLNSEFLAFNVHIYQDDLKLLLYLRSHPGAPRTQWPAQFQFDFSSFYFTDSAWNNFEQSPLFNLMPYDEQRRHGEYYFLFGRVNNQINLADDQLMKIDKLAAQESDISKLTPAQVDTLIDAISEMIVICNRIHTRYDQLHKVFPDEFPEIKDIPYVSRNSGDFKSSEGEKLHDKNLQIYLDASSKFK